MSDEKSLDRLRDYFGLVRPGIQEQVNHTAHTQVTIPWRQAMLAAFVRFSGYLGIAMGLALSAGAGIAFQQGFKLLGIALLAVFAVGLLFGCAAYRPRQILLKRLETEIEDPFRDSPMIELMRELMERMEPPEPEIQTEADPRPYHKYQRPNNHQPPEPEEPKLSRAFEDLLAFAREAAMRGLARDTAWCAPNEPRVTLSTGTVVSKPKWREFCERLVEWGVVEQDTTGYRWVNDDPQAAIAHLEKAAENALDPALWTPEEPIP